MIYNLQHLPDNVDFENLISAGSILNPIGEENGPSPIFVNATARTVYSWLRLKLVSTKDVVVAFKVILEWHADPFESFIWIWYPMSFPFLNNIENDNLVNFQKFLLDVIYKDDFN